VDKKILKLLTSLGKESQRQRSSESRPLANREMLAITPETGIFFSILLKSIRARNVLEVGTASGYSTLWFADALLSLGGRKRPSIVTIEANPAKVRWARTNFRKAGVSGIATILEGNAVDILRGLDNAASYDFVFIDADKENIKKYFDLSFPLVRIGGIIAADNMLFPEHYRPHMKRYAEHVRKNARVQSVTVPIGMGEEITLKLR
jgi:caffeoyl-CoA O-methyltransferase